MCNCQMRKIHSVFSIFSDVNVSSVYFVNGIYLRLFYVEQLQKGVSLYGLVGLRFILGTYHRIKKICLSVVHTLVGIRTPTNSNL